MTTAETTTVRLCACGCGQPTKPAAKTNTKLGHVKGQPIRYLKGHASGWQPLRADAPPCVSVDLKRPRCRGCSKHMHHTRRQHQAGRRCQRGHPPHAGRGICTTCAYRVRKGLPIELRPIEQPRMHPGEVLDEWVWLRGSVRWVDFHTKVGLTYKGWQKLFYRAERDGDPRAVKHPDDEPVRHWRADGSDEKRRKVS